jgi:predicted nucleic acid-binding protein
VKVALDTNILAYAEGVNGPTMQRKVTELIEALPVDSIVIPVQVLAELYNLLQRRVGQTGGEAAKNTLRWLDEYPAAELSASGIASSIQFASAHRHQIWDSLVLAASVEAGCTLMLSEDFQDGFTWRGLTVANPFASPTHPVLARLLNKQ